MARPFSFMFCISLESLRPVKCQTILDWSATLGGPLLAMTSSPASCSVAFRWPPAGGVQGSEPFAVTWKKPVTTANLSLHYSSMHRHKFPAVANTLLWRQLEAASPTSGPPHLRPNRKRHGVDFRVETNECRPRLHTSQLNAPQFRSPGDIYSARSYLIPTLRGLIQTYPIEACTTAIGRTHLLVCCS